MKIQINAIYLSSIVVIQFKKKKQKNLAKTLIFLNEYAQLSSRSHAKKNINKKKKTELISPAAHHNTHHERTNANKLRYIYQKPPFLNLKIICQ